MDTKKCSFCFKTLPLESFHLNPSAINPKRPRSKCKSCDAIYAKKYLKENHRRVCETSLAYQRKNPEKRRNYKFKYRYRMSIDDYNELLKLQDNKCSICKSEYTGAKNKKVFCVDHDHKTRKNRGLLCNKCNKGLGDFDDDIDTLKNAIEYLNKYNAK